jgi:C-terminal processing protease CtpA/Prc
MGLFSGDNPKSTQTAKTGLLGIEMEATADAVKITKILDGSPADKEDSRLNIGETINKVNGKKVSANIDFDALMDETAGEAVLLELSDKTGKLREVKIWPVASLAKEIYEDWVNERKRLTEEYSNGRLGYIHIQGMDWKSFERFERELMAAGYGKEGIVIDVRYNGGGWTSDYLMAILTVRQHSYTVPRGAAADLKDHKKFKEYYPYGERLPFAAWTKPSIALCNESSFSNAEIFSHAYKELGLGKLVGKATYGAVISTGAYNLIDGSYVRMPFRGWFVKSSGMNMENGPAVPDVELDVSPDHKAKGKDEQLKKAVELLLGEIKG